jgi:replicative DNA helicase
VANPPLERIPPSNIEAEQAALGAMMLDPAAADHAIHSLSPTDFYRDAHRTIFSAAADLRRRQMEVDIVTVGDVLRAAGQLDAVGGMLYLVTIAEQMPSSAGIRAYCAIVRDASRLRALILTCDRLQNAAYTAKAGDAQAVIESAEAEVLSLSQSAGVTSGFQPLRDYATRAWREIADAVRPAEGSDHPPLLYMPWQSLRRVIRPLRPGTLTVIAGRPGMGKSVSGLAAALAWANQGHAGAISTLEMTGESLGMRAMIMSGKSDANDIRDIEDGAFNAAEIDLALRTLADACDALPVNLYVDPAAHTTVRTLSREVRVLKSRVPDLRFLVVDYVQLMSGEGRSKAEEVSGIAKGLREIAKEHRLAVVALAQLSRLVEAERPHRPQLSHLKESGGLEESADSVLLLYRPSSYGGDECKRAKFPWVWDSQAQKNIYDGITEIHIAKQRSGEPGGRVRLWLEGARHDFRELTDPERDAIRNAGRQQ